MSAPAYNRFLRALRLAVLVPLARLRFLFILGAIGVLIVKWDDFVARYEKYTRVFANGDAPDPDHEYFCPMHPTVIRDNKKELCPICRMPLSKRKKGEAGEDQLPAGIVARVQLSPYRVALAGVKTAPVEYHTLSREINTVGTVEFDERKLTAVAARVKGRIDTLYVDQTGQMVHAGDPLAEIYSPDLVVTVQNLLDARASGTKSLEMIARDKLDKLGIDPKQIDAIAAAGKPISHMTINSPIEGHVLKKYVRKGQYVEEGGPLFDVADLKTVWIQAQLYEDDIAFLPAGGHDPKSGKPEFELPVIANTRAFPGKPFRGTLAFLFPHVDAETRTLTVRFDVPNKKHELRPGMSATVALKLDYDLLMKTSAGAGLRTRDGKILAVSEGSVIDTGAQKLVYRESFPNMFDGVAVELGPKLNNADRHVYYPVLSGLNEGDKVVTAGSFLIDAETRLNPAMGSIYVGGSSGGKAGGMAVRPTTPDDDAEKIKVAMQKLSLEDRKLAQAQRLCPILNFPLGAMGPIAKIELDGKPVFLCCNSCIKDAKANSAQTLARVEELKKNAPNPPSDPHLAPLPSTPSPPVPKPTADELVDIRAELAKLPPEDRAIAQKQRLCPVQDAWIGSMPAPKKLMIQGQAVYLCCKACEKKALANPELMLKKVEESKKLPPILPEGKP